MSDTPSPTDEKPTPSTASSDQVTAIDGIPVPTESTYPFGSAPEEDDDEDEDEQ